MPRIRLTIYDEPAELLGLTWPGVSGSLTSAMGRLERPLWDAEVDLPIADAITKLPS